MNKILIAAAGLVAGSAALAQTAPVAAPVPPAPMARPGPMADRAMTRQEMVAKVREHFARLDADRNGAITKEEMMQGRQQMAGHMKGMHHGGGAPHVMMMRGHGDPNAAFDRLDANKDGSISRDEFAKAREERIERRVEIREERKQGKEGGKRDVLVHRMGGFGGARMIVMADTDKDGKITQAEAEALALQHFDRLDSNRDGTLTPEERRAGRTMIIKKKIEDKQLEL